MPKLSTVVNVLLFLAGASCLALGVFRLFFSTPADAGAALTAGLVLLLASTVDRFESLKGLGIEAKTRKLDDKINQADQLLRHIQGLAELTSGSLVRLYAGMGRMGVAPNAEESHALTCSVRTALNGVGTVDTDIRRILRPWASIQAFDLARKLLEPLQKRLYDIRNTVNKEADRIEREHGHSAPECAAAHQKREDVDQFIRRFSHLHKWPLEEVPRMMIEMVTEAPYLPSEEGRAFMETINSWRSELEYLIEHHDLRHPDRWYKELAEVS